MGWFISSCNKDTRFGDSREITTTFSERKTDNSIGEINGRLVFVNQDHFEKTLDKLGKEGESNIPKDFISYYSTFTAIQGSLKTEEDFRRFIESEDFEKYFRVDIDDEGLKSMEPIWDSYLFGSVLNTNLEVQIGDLVYKYDENYEYQVPADLYSRSNFRQMAEEINPILREVKISDHKRDDLLDDCTEFFNKKNGSWQNKMQGKIWYTGSGPWWEWKVETRSRKRGSFGWWVSNNKYDLEQTGSLVATVNFNNGNPPQSFTLNVNNSCDECTETNKYINNSSFPVSITTYTLSNLAV
ncbi:MAG: hypothetical protein KDC53_21410 [Saprospiraceae bacterium]|nr:hypothetical protein [Saprospiraceae bacterium]